VDIYNSSDIQIPAASNSNAGQLQVINPLSNSTVLGLAIGLGVGVPMLLLVIFLVVFFAYKSLEIIQKDGICDSPNHLKKMIENGRLITTK
jgi:hypothetical protein